METRNPTIGDNLPPLSERLGLDYGEDVRATEALAARANAAPREITGDEDLHLIRTLVGDARTLSKTIDAKRVEEKAPHLEAGRTVDEFFGALTKRLARIADAFQRIADDHATKLAKEAKRRAAEEAALKRAEEEKARAAARAAEEAARPKVAAKADAKAEEAARAAAELEAKPAADFVPLASDGEALGKLEWTYEVEDPNAIDLVALRPYLKLDAVEVAIRAFMKMGGRKLAGVRIFQKVKAKI